MEFQLVFLSLTHTRAGSFAYILLAVLHVCTIQTLAFTLTPPFMHAHAGTCSHAYKGFAWAKFLSMFMCWGLLTTFTKGYAFTSSQAWSVYTYSCADPLLKMLLAFCSYAVWIYSAHSQTFVGWQRISGQRNTIKPNLIDLVRWIYIRHEFSLGDALTSLAN